MVYLLLAKLVLIACSGHWIVPSVYTYRSDSNIAWQADWKGWIPWETNVTYSQLISSTFILGSG